MEEGLSIWDYAGTYEKTEVYRRAIEIGTGVKSYPKLPIIHSLSLISLSVSPHSVAQLQECDI